jgi:hypothetical protein
MYGVFFLGKSATPDSYQEWQQQKVFVMKSLENSISVSLRLNTVDALTIL